LRDGRATAHEGRRDRAMRQVATLPDERQARRFADFLLTQGITTKLDPSDAGWVVWVHHEDKLGVAREEVERFLANTADPRYEGTRTITQLTTVDRSTGLDAIRRGEVWRLVTPILLHFGIAHLVFNMIWLYQLGGLVELRKGHLAMAAIVLASAVVSNLGEYV